MDERVLRELQEALREGYAAEVYTTITGRVRADRVTWEPTAGSYRVEDYVQGMACSYCGIVSDHDLSDWLTDCDHPDIIIREGVWL